MLDNRLNILHISKPMTTLEINIFITLTPNFKKKIKINPKTLKAHSW